MAFNLQSKSILNNMLTFNQINSSVSQLIILDMTLMFFSLIESESNVKLILPKGKFLSLMINVGGWWACYTHILTGYLKPNFLTSYLVSHFYNSFIKYNLQTYNSSI